jgi:DMSO reductase family type II enzyme heme b subunit
MSIRPANLTQGWNYRGWPDARSVMLRVVTGIDGSQMPSYAEAVSPEDAWQLAYYVTSLHETPHWDRIARAAAIEGTLPTTPEDPRWAQVERTDVRLRHAVNADGAWEDAPTVDRVSVQAVFNAEAVAFRLTWDDPSEDVEAADTVALVLKPEGVRGDVVSLQAWPYDGAPALDLCYWFAGAGFALEVVVPDFRPPIAAEATPAERTASAQYDDGRWSLIIQRPLHPMSPEGAAAFTSGEATSMAVVIWDGGTGSPRAVSPWQEIVLGAPETPHAH